MLTFLFLGCSAILCYQPDLLNHLTQEHLVSDSLLDSSQLKSSANPSKPLMQPSGVLSLPLHLLPSSVICSPTPKTAPGAFPCRRKDDNTLHPTRTRPQPSHLNSHAILGRSPAKRLVVEKSSSDLLAERSNASLTKGHVTLTQLAAVSDLPSAEMLHEGLQHTRAFIPWHQQRYPFRMNPESASNDEVLSFDMQPTMGHNVLQAEIDLKDQENKQRRSSLLGKIAAVSCDTAQSTQTIDAIPKKLSLNISSLKKDKGQLTDYKTVNCTPVRLGF